MKKILSIISFVICFQCSFGQTYVRKDQVTADQWIKSYGYVIIDDTLIVDSVFVRGNPGKWYSAGTILGNVYYEGNGIKLRNDTIFSDTVIQYTGTDYNFELSRVNGDDSCSVLINDSILYLKTSDGNYISIDTNGHIATYSSDFIIRAYDEAPSDIAKFDNNYISAYRPIKYINDLPYLGNDSIVPAIGQVMDSIEKKAFTFGELYIDTITSYIGGEPDWTPVDFTKIGFSSKTNLTTNSIEAIDQSTDAKVKVTLLLKCKSYGNNVVVNNVWLNGAPSSIGDTINLSGDTTFIKLSGYLDNSSTYEYYVKSTGLSLNLIILSASLVVTDSTSLYEASMRYSDFIADSSTHNLVSLPQMMDSITSNVPTIDTTKTPELGHYGTQWDEQVIRDSLTLKIKYRDTTGTAPKISSGQDLRDTARNLRTTLNGKATLTDSSFLKYTANGIKPRSTQISGGWDNSSVAPSHTTSRNNYDGILYATKFLVIPTNQIGFQCVGTSNDAFYGSSTTNGAFYGLSTGAYVAKLATSGSGGTLTTNLLRIENNYTNATSGDMISIIDNPGGGSTGRLFYGSQGIRNTIVLGSALNTGTINLFDSYRHITGVNKVFEVRDSGEIKVNIGHDSINVKNASLYVFNNISSTKKIAATDSLCLGAFRFIIKYDTLCSVKGTDTLRIHPKRP